MNATFFLFPLAAVIMLMMPFIPFYKGITTGKRAKYAMICNLCGFFGVAAIMVILSMSQFIAVAEEVAAGTAGMTMGNGLAFLSAALVTSVSCIGAAIAISAAAPAAIGAFSEDPSAFGKALIFVALGEGIGLYGLLISILIVNKL